MFSIDTSLIFWSTISFLILLVLLYKFVFPPLNKMLEQRRQAIEGKIEEAQKAQTEAKELLKQYQLKLGEAEQKTMEMFDDAQRKAQAVRDETLKTAQKEARDVIEKSKKDIEVFKRKALVDMKEDIAKIVADVSRRLIRKRLSAQDNIKLVESSIRDLEKNAKRKI